MDKTKEDTIDRGENKEAIEDNISHDSPWMRLIDFSTLKKKKKKKKKMNIEEFVAKRLALEEKKEIDQGDKDHAAQPLGDETTLLFARDCCKAEDSGRVVAAVGLQSGVEKSTQRRGAEHHQQHKDNVLQLPESTSDFCDTRAATDTGKLLNQQPPKMVKDKKSLIFNSENENREKTIIINQIAFQYALKPPPWLERMESPLKW
ncbi:uncharacterized protein LOC129005453, partial [Macrosteles quadrilineatus]|uniref:uncharacterized protein LOC129005453 n=1 Tax=Macrosteles quadrilineatus TaxID=74068 RepID=UPI0023E0DF88